jgi:hypothetical protein
VVAILGVLGIAVGMALGGELVLDAAAAALDATRGREAKRDTLGAKLAKAG